MLRKPSQTWFHFFCQLCDGEFRARFVISVCPDCQAIANAINPNVRHDAGEISGGG